MNLIELHILRNYPLSCLNRDENGSPKSFRFGGHARASFSSQCIKRAVRMYLKQTNEKSFGGVRTKYFIKYLEDALLARGINEEQAKTIAIAVGSYYSIPDSKDKTGYKTSTSLFISSGEVNAIVEYFLDIINRGELDKVIVLKAKKAKKKANKAVEDSDEDEPSVATLKNSAFLKNIHPSDMGDIALFGRMIANDNSLKIEAITSFSYPFSVNSCSNEIDFFSTVEESSFSTDPGASHIGETEFNSACYYSYVGIDLDELNNGILKTLSVEERKEMLKELIAACIIVTPPASKNSKFAATPPYSVLGLTRHGKFQVSLSNAFEVPIKPGSDGYSVAATKKLSEHWEDNKKTFGKRLGVRTERTFILGDSLDEFIDGLVDHE